MSDYYVGPAGDYEQPQNAIDQLKADVGAGAFGAEHRIAFTDGSTYDGYALSGLTPTSANRLVVTCVTNDVPTVIARVASGGRKVKAQGPVQLSIPYVTLERHEVRGGAYGILAGAGSDGLRIVQMMVRDPWRAGIVIRNSVEVVIFNSVVFAPITCLVARSA